MVWPNYRAMNRHSLTCFFYVSGLSTNVVASALIVDVDGYINVNENHSLRF